MEVQRIHHYLVERADDNGGISRNAGHKEVTDAFHTISVSTWQRPRISVALQADGTGELRV